MANNSLASTPKSKKPRRRALGRTEAARSVYRTLAKAPSVDRRRAQLLAGHCPDTMSDAEWQEFLATGELLWPNNKEIDYFLAWLKKGRRTGKY